MIASRLLWGAFSGIRLSAHEKAFFRYGKPSGVTLFRRNIDAQKNSLGEKPPLVEELRALSSDFGYPFWIAVDQEGGRVSRFKENFPDEGPALLFSGDWFDYGSRVGRALRDRDLDINWAPVVDVGFKDESLGDRVLAQDPELVTDKARHFLRGLQSEGIRGCLKHFPGQGRFIGDTHKAGGMIEADQKAIETWDLLPFKKLLHEVSFVMVSHSRYSAGDQTEASRSSFWIHWLKYHGFKGLIVSDDLDMGAVEDKEEFLVDSLAAGCHIFLLCGDLGAWEQAEKTLSYYVSKSPFLQSRVYEACEIIQRTLKK